MASISIYIFDLKNIRGIMGIIMKKANRNKTLKLAFIGIMCALTTVVTWVLPIPMPATEGYINFGDAVIFLTALFAGPVPAMVVGGIGSMLADVIGGYMHWAGFTLLIKGLEGLICGLIVKKLNKKDKFYIDILGLVAAGVWMVVGYYFAGAILYGWAGSLESLPGNCIQGGVSIVVAYMLYAILKRMYAVQGFIERLNEPMFVKKPDEATEDNEQPESIVDTGNTDENNAEQPDAKSDNPSDK